MSLFSSMKSQPLPPEFAEEAARERRIERQATKTRTLAYPEIKKLRSVHHMVAQLVAKGESNETISVITGFDPIYVCNMQNNPSFQGLIEHYRTLQEIKKSEVLEKLSKVGETATEILHERLLECEEDFSNRDLNEIIDMTIMKPANVAVKAKSNVEVARNSPEPRFIVQFRSALPAPSESPLIEGEIVK